MTREQAWTHYFNTGDREPLVKAYWDSISYLAWATNPQQKEDYFQVGMMGLLKAIDRIDPNRVKSKDAWVWLNVKGMMFNQTPPRDTVSLDAEENHFEYLNGEEYDFAMRIDLVDALKTPDPISYLDNYRPSVLANKERVLERYRRGELSRRGIERELGISARQAYKLIGNLPDTW